ncbi:hypothetical protein SAMN05216174_11921 [Actinokineospora iranica]|uniref:Uncharacterized protein n=1 Tax=Actinokineospora iranica TaxID=1271860 RepID=A0A1G6XVC5_9PSEU|nr:hypothetical protein SAMN05216174_11921 [Actinokineospora iranica]
MAQPLLGIRSRLAAAVPARHFPLPALAIRLQPAGSAGWLSGVVEPLIEQARFPPGLLRRVGRVRNVVESTPRDIRALLVQPHHVGARCSRVRPRDVGASLAQAPPRRCPLTRPPGVSASLVQASRCRCSKSSEPRWQGCVCGSAPGAPVECRRASRRAARRRAFAAWSATAVPSRRLAGTSRRGVPRPAGRHRGGGRCRQGGHPGAGIVDCGRAAVPVRERLRETDASSDARLAACPRGRHLSGGRLVSAQRGRAGCVVAGPVGLGRPQWIFS